MTCVEGTWTQPTITCPATGLASVAIWVGIDGTTAAGGLPNASATLAQVGTAGDCAEGQLQVMAWYEFLPDLHHEVPMSVQVRAGDKIWAQVRYLGKGKFRATLVNLTLKVGASQTWTVRGAPLLTAEWIVEAPASQCSADSCSILPLAKFSTVAMDGYTTLNNRRYRVSAVPDPYLRISIARRGHVLAAPGSLKSGGGFNVIWKGS